MSDFFKTHARVAGVPDMLERKRRWDGRKEDSSDQKGCLGPESYDNITQNMGQKATEKEGYIIYIQIHV